MSLLLRCARTIQFDIETINLISISNGDAVHLGEINKDDRKVIPCDRQVLPTLDEPEQITISFKRMQADD